MVLADFPTSQHRTGLISQGSSSILPLGRMLIFVFCVWVSWDLPGATELLLSRT
jgi:hypothetical protein